VSDEPGASSSIPGSVHLPDEFELELEADRRLALEGRTLRVHTARGGIINAGFQVGLGALAVIRRLVVAAFLTTSEFGLWGLLLATILTLAWLKEVGVSDKYIQQDQADQKLAFQQAFTLECAYSAIVYAFIAAALPVYAVIYDNTSIIVPGLVLSLALFGTALQSPIWVAYREMRFVRQRTLEAIDPVVATIATVTLAVIGLGYWALVWGAVIGSFCGAAAALLTCPFPIRVRFDKTAFREYVRFSWPLFTAQASALAVVQGSVLVGNYAVGLSGLGIIGIAGAFTELADRADQIVSRTIYPAICAVRDRRALLFEAFVKSNRLAMMWGIPFGIGVALFASDLITFALGERWRGAEHLIQVCGLVVGAGQIGFNWNTFMSALNRTRPMAVSGFAAVLAFAMATAPLMILLGLTGYGIGIAVGMVVQLSIRAFYLKRLFSEFRFLRHVVRTLAASVPAVAGLLAVRLVETGDRTLPVALAELCAYVLLTIAGTWLLERRLINEIWAYLRGGASPLAIGAAQPSE